jgi:hypothetical protein
MLPDSEALTPRQLRDATRSHQVSQLSVAYYVLKDHEKEILGYAGPPLDHQFSTTGVLPRIEDWETKLISDVRVVFADGSTLLITPEGFSSGAIFPPSEYMKKALQASSPSKDRAR